MKLTLFLVALEITLALGVALNHDHFYSPICRPWWSCHHPHTSEKPLPTPKHASKPCSTRHTSTRTQQASTSIHKIKSKQPTSSHKKDFTSSTKHASSPATKKSTTSKCHSSKKTSSLSKSTSSGSSKTTSNSPPISTLSSLPASLSTSALNSVASSTSATISTTGLGPTMGVSSTGSVSGPSLSPTSIVGSVIQPPSNASGSVSLPGTLSIPLSVPLSQPTGPVYTPPVSIDTGSVSVSVSEPPLSVSPTVSIPITTTYPFNSLCIPSTTGNLVKDGDFGGSGSEYDKEVNALGDVDSGFDNTLGLLADKDNNQAFRFHFLNDVGTIRLSQTICLIPLATYRYTYHVGLYRASITGVTGSGGPCLAAELVINDMGIAPDAQNSYYICQPDPTMSFTDEEPFGTCTEPSYDPNTFYQVDTNTFVADREINNVSLSLETDQYFHYDCPLTGVIDSFELELVALPPPVTPPEEPVTL